MEVPSKIYVVILLVILTGTLPATSPQIQQPNC